MLVAPAAPVLRALAEQIGEQGECWGSDIVRRARVAADAAADAAAAAPSVGRTLRDLGRERRLRHAAYERELSRLQPMASSSLPPAQETADESSAAGGSTAAAGMTVGQSHIAPSAGKERVANVLRELAEKWSPFASSVSRQPHCELDFFVESLVRQQRVAADAVGPLAVQSIGQQCRALERVRRLQREEYENEISRLLTLARPKNGRESERDSKTGGLDGGGDSAQVDSVDAHRWEVGELGWSCTFEPPISTTDRPKAAKEAAGRSQSQYGKAAHRQDKGSGRLKSSSRQGRKTAAAGAAGDGGDAAAPVSVSARTDKDLSSLQGRRREVLRQSRRAEPRQAICRQGESDERRRESGAAGARPRGRGKRHIPTVYCPSDKRAVA
jgi:hypothetical protein